MIQPRDFISVFLRLLPTHAQERNSPFLQRNISKEYFKRLLNPVIAYCIVVRFLACLFPPKPK